MKIRFALHSEQSNPARRDRRVVFAIWHEGLIVPAYTHLPQKIAIMVSNHRDGEILAQIARWMGGYTARGSTTRGGAAATLSMLRQSEATQLAITPDGPKGPRRKVQRGALYIASRGQMPLVPGAVSATRCWRLGSWDKMIIPKPGATVYVVLGEPMELPEQMDAEQTQQYMQQFQRAMDRAQDQADRLAAGENLDDELNVVHYKKTQTRNGVINK